MQKRACRKGLRSVCDTLKCHRAFAGLAAGRIRIAHLGYCQYNLKALTESADLVAGLGAANDVWGFETADGRSLRKSIDWLMACATGSTPWPYKQPEALDWQTMVVVLRLASRQFKNHSVLTLQLPPAYVLGAGCL